MSKKLVSILTPCYNGETYIMPYLESILAQTYTNIQLIFVNDGSKDNTEKIFTEFSKKLENRGINVKYIYQANAGQAAAVNNGLKYVEGDYLIWPDSDDFLDINLITKCVEFFEKNTDCGIIGFNANCYDVLDLNSKIGENVHVLKEKATFEDYLMENGVLSAQTYMMDFKKFLQINPKREIYIHRGGQNWQLTLPMIYNFKVGYMDDFLYNYVVRDNSHSHAPKSKEQIYNKYDGHEDILINVVSSINMLAEEKSRYINLIKTKYARTRLIQATEYKDKKTAKEAYIKLKQHAKLVFKDRRYYLMSQFPILYSLKLLVNRIRDGKNKK